MSAKLKLTTRYLLREQLKILGYVYLMIVVSIVCFPLGSALITRQLTSQTILNTLQINLGFTFGCVIFIIMTFTYDNFKLLIQNGISRRTYWRARVLTVIALSFIGDLVATSYHFLVNTPLQHRTFTSGFNHLFYAQLYGDFFGRHNLAGNFITNLIFMWLVFIMLGLSGMAIGSIFSLLTKSVRRIVFIAVPVLGFVFLAFLVNLIARFPSQVSFEGTAKFLGFLAGYTGQSTGGTLNPLMPMVTMLVISAMMGAIATYFNHKLKLKNA